MTIERRAKRVTLSVAMILVPAALLFLMRDGLVTKVLDSFHGAEPTPTLTLNSTHVGLSPDKNTWSTVSIKDPQPEAAVPSVAPAAPAASATVAPVPAAKEAIAIHQPTQLVPIGKQALH